MSNQVTVADSNVITIHTLLGSLISMNLASYVIMFPEFT